MKYINYITDEIINDVNQIEILFNTYEYLTWIIMIFLWIVWLMIKYTIITLPFRMLITNPIAGFLVTLRNSLPKKR